MTLSVGCGGSGESAGSEATAGSEQPAATASAEAPALAWLADVPPGGTLAYDVVIEGGEPRRVQMRVQELVRRGSGVAILLAPVGTPLDEEPVYARWMVGEDGVLVGLDEHASLTTEAGYAPLDESGRMATEAGESVAWRLPRDWLTPGRGVAGDEVSAGWRLAERLGDVSQPVPGHDCARLEREEAGERATLVVCANLGLVESTSGSAGPRWTLVAIEGPPEAGTETAPE